MNRIAQLGAETVKGFGAIAATPIKMGTNVARSTLGVATSQLLDKSGITPVTSFFRSISSEIGSTYNSLFGSGGARNETKTRIPNTTLPSGIPEEKGNTKLIFESLENQSQKIDALFNVIKELNNNFLRNSSEQLKLARMQNLTLKRMNNVLGNFAKYRQNKLRMERLDKKNQKRIIPQFIKNENSKSKEKTGMFSGLLNTLSGLGNLIGGLSMIGSSFLRRKGGGIAGKAGLIGLAAAPFLGLGSAALSIIVAGTILGYIFKDEIKSFLNTMKNSFLEFIKKAENFLNPKAQPRDKLPPQIAVSPEVSRSITTSVNETLNRISSTDSMNKQNTIYENLISKLRSMNISREQMRTVLRETNLSGEEINNMIRHIYMNNSSSEISGQSNNFQMLGNANNDRLIPGSSNSIETRNTFFNNSSTGALKAPGGIHVTVPVINNNNSIAASANSSGGNANKSKSYGRLNATKISSRGSLFNYKAVMA